MTAAVETATLAAAAERVMAIVAQRGLTHLSLGCFDWNGRLRAKQFHVRNLRKALRTGTAMTSAIFAPDTAERPIATGPFHDPARGYRDACLRLLPETLRDYPLEANGQGLVLLGQLEGEFSAFCPRALLVRELERLHALGFDAYGAFEIEYHLLQETAGSLRQKIPSKLRIVPATERMYSLVDQTAAEPIFAGLRAFSERMRIPLDTLHAEFTGLIEAALSPLSGVAIADHAALFKTMAKALARQHGLLATFMAKLSNEHESAGAHLNLSLRHRATGESASYDRAATDHMSSVLRHFIGGLQCYGPELFILSCPHINSFKRLTAESFAPRTNTWGIDNKTCAYRVVNSNAALMRIEIRVPGADINPYLCLAAWLAAGRRGIELALAPTPAACGNAWEETRDKGAPFPRDYAQAVACFRESVFARETLGAAFVDAFAQSRDWQLQERDRCVTDWELRQFGEGV